MFCFFLSPSFNHKTNLRGPGKINMHHVAGLISTHLTSFIIFAFLKKMHIKLLIINIIAYIGWEPLFTHYTR